MACSEFISNSATETEKIGELIGSRLKKGDFVAYSGDLGAGKTTISRGIVKGTGTKADVSSPTFALVNEYEGDLTVYHFDMYRICTEEGLETTGFYDYPLEDSVFLVEWSENIPFAIPENAIKINISSLDENRRKISVEGDERFEQDTWN